MLVASVYKWDAAAEGGHYIRVSQCLGHLAHVHLDSVAVSAGTVQKQNCSKHYCEGQLLLALLAKEEEELPGSYLCIGDNGHAGLKALQRWQLWNQSSYVALQLAV